MTQTQLESRIFDLNNKRMTGSNRGQLRINFCDLLIDLWPGAWQNN